MQENLLNSGISIQKEAQRAGIKSTVWQLPFVYVYERSDFSVSLYAFQVYPETIRKAVQHPQFEDHVTGKFTLRTVYDEKSNQRLEVNIELRSDKEGSPSLEKKLVESIVANLLRENSEYRKTHSEMADRIHPHIVFWKYEHETYFKPGRKQKWVLKQK
jgi:phenylacetate-CoA ligase